MGFILGFGSGLGPRVPPTGGGRIAVLRLTVVVPQVDVVGLGAILAAAPAARCWALSMDFSRDKPVDRDVAPTRRAPTAGGAAPRDF